MTRRALYGILAVGAGALAITAALAGPTAEITYLWSDGLPANPYFVPSRALLLYGAAPLFSAAAVLMLLGPGVTVVLAWSRGRGESWPSLVARGFLVAYGMRVSIHSVAKLLGASLTPSLFWGCEVLLLAGAGAFLLHRSSTGRMEMPGGTPWRLGLIVLIPAVVTVLLLPIIFWQDFTEDGMEALEIGLSLADFVVPRFQNDTGFMGLGIGMLSMAPPVSWFIQLLGPTEAAARLPLVFYLPAAASTLIALAEHGDRRVGILGDAMIVTVLGAYVAVMGYSATYDAYAADLSAPTAFETLTLLALSGALLGLWQERRGTFLGFVVLGYLARPTALMWLLLLIGSSLLAFRGERRWRMARDLALGVGACVLLVVVYEELVLRMLSDGAMSYDAESVLSRYQFISFFDVRRFLWVMIPGGIVPFLALFAVRRHDPFGLQLSLALLLYFVAFFFPAYVALHHFVPVMVLPVVVFLRLTNDLPAWTLRGAALVALVGLGLSLPRYTHVDRSSREIGTRMFFGVGAYDGPWDRHRTAVMTRGAVFELFPATWDVADPSEVRVGASMPFLYYSSRADVSIDAADYAILPEAAPAPEGLFRVGTADGATAYARDTLAWEADRADTPPTSFGNPLFVLPPETLFSFVGAPAGEHDLNLNTVPLIWRLF